MEHSAYGKIMLIMLKLRKDIKYINCRTIISLFFLNILFSACARVNINYRDDGTGITPIVEYKVVSNISSLKLHGMLVDKNNNPLRYYLFKIYAGNVITKDIYTNHKGVFKADITYYNKPIIESSFYLVFPDADIDEIYYSFPFKGGKVFKKDEHVSSSVMMEGNILVINPN